MPTNGHALTLRGNKGRLPALLTPCKVCLAFDPATHGPSAHPPRSEFQALWDTGATATVVSQAVIDRCGLKPIGMAISETANGEHATETYVINLLLINGVQFLNVTVTRGNFSPKAKFDVLIGMDVITMGDFSITNKNGKTVFSFRTPSLEEIDYVKEINDSQKPPKWDPWHKKKKRGRR